MHGSMAGGTSTETRLHLILHELHNDAPLHRHDQRIALQAKFPGALKRAFDFTIAASLLIMLSPLVMIVASIIRRDGGPALFRQKRLGQHGRVFTCLKFRSMVINSDPILKRHLEMHPHLHAEWQSYKKLRTRDPRVTRIGTWLRRYSLDEVPQLINVVRGEMSLVGPRPILVTEQQDYGHALMDYKCVRPGITGLWQISGRNDVTFVQRAQLDSSYIHHWSLWNDIRILWQTLPAVLKRNGAY